MYSIGEKRNFLTITKETYSFAVDRNIKKVYRFYSGQIFPPTIGYTMSPSKCSPLNPIEPTLGLSLNEVPDEIKKRFAENIEIQENILSKIKKRNEEFHYRCGLIRLTTGKGKSHVIMDITNYYQTNTLILVHNIKTLKEMVQKFKEFTNITPSQYGGGKKEIGTITICTKRSFCTDYKHFVDKKIKLFLIDEAPVQFSKKLWDAINIYCHGSDGVALYGLSGTPYKDDLKQEDLEKYFGLTIEVKGQKNNGYNIIPTFHMLDYKSFVRYEFESPAEMRTALAEDPARLSAQIREIEDMMDKRNCLLILTDRVQEVENMEHELFKNGVPADLMFTMKGNTKKSEDDEEEENLKLAKEIVEKGGQVIIIGTIQKMAIGVDIPYIDTILLASAIKFKATVVQAIGRGLRKHSTKKDVIVGVWNDLPLLKKQKSEKMKAIREEYLLTNNDFIFNNI